MAEVKTKNAIATKQQAKKLAEKIKKMSSDQAIVLALSGELGAGKTTFTQGFAEAFGIKENVLSPTFVLMKMYKKESGVRHLVHIDAYRLESEKELLHLGFGEIVQDKDAVVLVEWAERVKKIIPKDAVWVRFAYGENKNERTITIENFK